MRQIIHLFSKPVIAIMMAILAAIGLGATYFIDNDRLAYHIDEYIFIRKAEFFELFFTQRNLKDPLWRELDAPQPKVGPYLFGATIYLHGRQNLKEYFQKLDFTIEKIDKVFQTSNYTALDNYNQIHQLIQMSRKTAIIFSILTFIGLALFLAHHRLSLYIIIINLIFLSQNLVLLQVGRRAMTDSMQLCALMFSLLFLSKLIKALSKKSLRSINLTSLALGLCSTLGAGVKSSGILAYLFICLVLGIATIYRKIAFKKIVLSFAIITITFFSMLIFLHPYTHQQTPRHVFDMFYIRIAGSYELQANYPTTAVNTRLDAAWRILRYTLMPFGRYNNIQGLPGLDLALFITGLIFITRQTKIDSKKRRISFETLLLTFFLLTFTSLTFYLRNDWSRYYLPVILANSLIQSYAVGQLVIKWSTSFTQNKS